MATFTLAGLTPEQILRFGRLLESQGASYAGQQKPAITLNDSPYSVTGPDGKVLPL